MKTIDLHELNVITEADLEAAARAGFDSVHLSERALLTPSACDVVSSRGLVLIRESRRASGQSPAPSLTDAAPEDLFCSPEATAIKEEIIRTGRKLWERQYVDGNGGNISARLRDRYVISTAAFCSKADLTTDDFALVDLEGNQLAGTKPRSSEILLHIEIYKAVPAAGAVVHCHPPHATAYALTGTIPPSCLVPEHEVLVGTVALAPYETPGTPEFAQTVLPYVRDHNMILLQNHGVVCWADSATHAEWYVEVVDTYCRTIVLASHLDAPLKPIPNRKASDLLEIKKKLGLPDARYNLKECQLCDLPDTPGSIAIAPRPCVPGNAGLSNDDMERLVQAVTDEVIAALAKKK